MIARTLGRGERAMKNDQSAVGAKKQAGIAAAAMVPDGSVVGLGTGSTAAFVIEELGRRIREEHLRCRGVPTSFSAALLARKHLIPITTLDEVEQLDVAIDGADEVDPQKNLIKGGGAAHTREKIVASSARRFIVVVDDSKLVDRLGSKWAVPVEVLPFGLLLAERRLKALGGEPVLRMAVKKDGPIITDQGNFILDVRFPSIDDPAGLEREINGIPGVLENGIFPGIAEIVLIAPADGGPVRSMA